MLPQAKEHNDQSPVGAIALVSNMSITVFLGAQDYLLSTSEAPALFKLEST